MESWSFLSSSALLASFGSLSMAAQISSRRRISSLVAWRAASLAASVSRERLSSWISVTFPSFSQNIMDKGWVRVLSKSSVIKLPSPWRQCTRPIISRARMASRTVARETPSCSDSWRSEGRRSPLFNCFVTMLFFICSKICKYIFFCGISVYIIHSPKFINLFYHRSNYFTNIKRK